MPPRAPSSRQVQYQSIIRELKQEVLDLKARLGAGGAPSGGFFPAIHPRPSLDAPHGRASPLGAAHKDALGEEDYAGRRGESEEAQPLGVRGAPAGRAARRAGEAGGGAGGGGVQSAEAAELAERAKVGFKARARLLGKLIEAEEAVYALKIDLSVQGVRRRRMQVRACRHPSVGCAHLSARVVDRIERVWDAACPISTG
jgi:hypothetical protein